MHGKMWAKRANARGFWRDCEACYHPHPDSRAEVLMSDRRKIVVAVVLVVALVLLLDLGGIRTDMVDGFRAGFNNSR